MSFITFNPSDCDSHIFLKSDNLYVIKSNESNIWRSVRATTSKNSGKWYYEVRITQITSNSYFAVGFGRSTASLNAVVGGLGSDSWGWQAHGALLFNNVASGSYGTGVVINDVINISIDIDAGKIWFGKNGDWFNSGNPATGANPSFTGVTGTLFPMVSIYTVGNTLVGKFTSPDLIYSPPSGFSSWGTPQTYDNILVSLLTSNIIGYWTLDESSGSTLFNINKITNINDFSTTPKSITINGNTKLSTTKFKFGNSSVYFDGTGDYISIPNHVDFDFGSGNFTIDFWVYLIGVSSVGGAIIGRYGSAPSTNADWLVFISSSYIIQLYVNGSLVVGSASSCPLGIWTHIAVVRLGNNFKIYVNGVSSGSTTISLTIQNSSSQMLRTCIWDNTTSYTNMFLDDLRIEKGTAIYTADFTPPTSELSSASSLLLHFNSDFIDSSTTNKSITLYGNTTLSTAQSKFGGSSVYFDGTGDYISSPSHSDFQLGTGNFNIEMWVYLNLVDMPAWATLIQIGTDASNGVFGLVRYNTSNPMGIRVDYYNSGWYSALDITNADIQHNTWHHIALTRQANTFRFFVDGVLKGSNNISINYFQSTFFLGARSNGNTPIKGYIDEFRLIKGIAIYTEDFSVPVKPFVTPTFSGTVVLHLTLNGSNGSTLFNDSSLSHKTITSNGNVQISTAQSKFGGSSVYFDGTGDYLSCSDSSDFAFGTGDFTIEFWIKTSNNSKTLIDRYNAASTNWQIFISSGGVIQWYTNTIFKAGTVVVTNDTWRHIAIVRSSNVLHFYIDGVEDGTGTTDNTNYSTTITTFAIGAQVNNRNASYDYLGYLDEIRIIKGAASYTTNFTPPTEEFSLLSNLLLHFNTSSYPLAITGTPSFSQSPLLTLTEGTSVDFQGANASGNFVSLHGLDTLFVGLFIKTSTANQTLLSKSGVFSISIDTNGKLVFTVNSFSLTSYSVVTTNLPIQILCKFELNNLEIFLNSTQDAFENFNILTKLDINLEINNNNNLTNTTLLNVPGSYSLSVDNNDKLVFTTPKGSCTSTSQVSNTSSIITSSNGITWNTRTAPVGNWSSVTYGGSLFVAVGYDSNIAITSTDGITWTQRTLPATAGWSAVGYGNGKYVAVSSGSLIGAISSDGITWTQTQIRSGTWNTVSYGLGKYFVSGFGDEIIYATNGYTTTNMYSSDGINWLITPMLYVASWQPYSSWVGGFHSASSYFLALPDGTRYGITTIYPGYTNDSNLANWNFPSSFTTQGLTWSAIGINGPKAIGFAKNTTTGIISNGGTGTWTNTTLPVSGDWKAASYGNSTYCVIATNSSIALTSTDGSTWTQRTLPKISQWNSLTFGNGVFVAVSGKSNIKVSAKSNSYSMSLFINGSQESISTINNTLNDFSSSPFVIGPMTGILDDVFIAKKYIDPEFIYKLAYNIPFDKNNISSESPFVDIGSPPADVLNQIYEKNESKNDLDCYYSTNITYTVNTSIPTLYIRSSFITIDGNITLGGIPASRKVLLMEYYNKDIVRETWSDPSTGYYSFSDIKYIVDYQVFCEDYVSGNQASKKVIVGVPTNLDPLSGSSSSSSITSQFSGYISSFGIFKTSSVSQSLIDNLFYSSNILGSFKIEGETYINNTKTQDISVLLLDSSYNKIKSTVSDVNGDFSFLNIHYASYYILTTVDSLTNVIKGPILPTPM